MTVDGIVEPVTLSVKDDADIVKVRQTGREMARALGFGVVDQTRIATALSELSRNVMLYAGGGEVTLRRVESGRRRGIEIVCEDHGPGIDRIDLVMQEGFTTGRGLGLGLPGAKRLMDDFEVRSEKGQGTRVVTRKWLT